METAIKKQQVINLMIPKDYRSVLNVKQTEQGIKLVKDSFESGLSAELKLSRVTAPLFVLRGTGINDDLNGVERPVSFRIKSMDDAVAEVVHSLAKWKRMMLADYGITMGYGIYTDMNALRPDEDLGNIHSIYVDQWDWERIIATEDRNIDFLKEIVKRIYSVIKRTEFIVYEHYPEIIPVLPDDITFIHSLDLFREYPGKSPKEREYLAAEKHGAIFIIGVGYNLPDGKPHDGRAPDYDDWSTQTSGQYHGLNGDIIIWNPVLKTSLEISSMGIRVDRKTLIRQLEIQGLQDRKELLFHRRLLNGEFTESIGGGIGQSRLCMYFLRKAHIGEVQASIWPGDMVKQCRESGIFLM